MQFGVLDSRARKKVKHFFTYRRMETFFFLRSARSEKCFTANRLSLHKGPCSNARDCLHT